MSTLPTQDTGKSYHKVCTGAALETTRKHADPSASDITLFASNFCPFVQRAWVTLEYLEIPYYYYEIDPYLKPKPADLLEVSPKGLVPALRLSQYTPPRAVNESTVIVEYLNDIVTSKGEGSKSLLPPSKNIWERMLIRLQADHISRSVVPAFYRYLQAQDPDAQAQGEKDFLDGIEKLITLFERAESESTDKSYGLWHEGGDLSLADVLVGPWLFRATNVLKYYRGFSFTKNTKFDKYLDRLFNHFAFKPTCSTEELYIDSYERYAFNRPNTSQVADAINKGRGLP